LYFRCDGVVARGGFHIQPWLSTTKLLQWYGCSSLCSGSCCTAWQGSGFCQPCMCVHLVDFTMFSTVIQSNFISYLTLFISRTFYLFIFMPPPFKEWWRGIKCYPCPCVRASVRPLSKFGVRSITFERLHRFNSNLVCWYIISKHRSSSIWVKIH